ncbi:hypothetical protein BDV25DRAFT_149798 [Aspergillus avenaceus]|uniref:Ubiquitin interaction motif protein n=1 Tax=Aspergillus avenaceus TaxID=36643 RepID=A0A5N6U3Z7_ASPAV|nr:hypothetical protein BDV25DRAFT_149798 [Aspergillus avenaceus]
MTSEPSEEAITNFVNFTSTTREQAISFLKANDLNSNKAINAYFEDPTGPQTETTNYQNASSVPSFHIEHSDPVPGPNLPSKSPNVLNEQASAPDHQQPSPAPSQNATGSGKGLSLAEQEERELQQAVAMSLNQNLGQQETGVTTSNSANFGRATRDYYDEGAWAMVPFSSSAREIIISPDPADRMRVKGEPAFLRPSGDSLYLGGLLTILHSIPLAREALLLRNKVLSNYGHDPQWWNGQPINLPKIVTIQDVQDGDTDWDDILYETQRLMAFLDATERSFGSVDALASLKSISTYDTEGSIARFFEKWQDSAVRADPESQLATVFSSQAHKRPLQVYDTPIQKDFFILESFVEPDHGRSLYDVLDRAIWADRPGEDLDDVWLEHVGEILTIKLESADTTQPVGVEIPAVFYPDRYLAEFRDFSRDFRTQKLQVYGDIFKLESLIDRLTASKSAKHKGLTFREILDKAAAATTVTLSKGVTSGAAETSLRPEAANPEAQRLADELREISKNIEDKLKELEKRKESAIEALRNYTNILTEPSSSGLSPHHKYTLRGVCTEPHVTYLLRPDQRGDMEDSESTAVDGWQWWRVSFSTDDGRARQTNSKQDDTSDSKNADVIGYTARKVQEAEVLRAAREECKSVLLIYAKTNAINVDGGPAPASLQEFVNADNIAFGAEFESRDHSGNQAEEYSQGAGAASAQDEVANTIAASDEDQQKDSTAANSTSHVNVFDFQVSSFDEAGGANQEMKKKGGRSLLN